MHTLRYRDGRYGFYMYCGDVWNSNSQIQACQFHITCKERGYERGWKYPPLVIWSTCTAAAGWNYRTCDGGVTDLTWCTSVRLLHEEYVWSQMIRYLRCLQRNSRSTEGPW